MRINGLILLALISIGIKAQNFTFNFWDNGQRVCLIDASVNVLDPSITINFREAVNNSTQAVSVFRRQANGNGSDWLEVATNLPPGTASWTDQNVNAGEVWEYQVKRNTGTAAAFGYTMASIQNDQSNYRGQLILLVADNISEAMPLKLEQLKRDLTGDGWYVNQLVFPRATGWDSGDTVIIVKSLISDIYNNAPSGDKPKLLFILGHLPLPRSGLNGQAPDDHTQNAGARGADTYYADIDGVFTDLETYNPGGLSSPLATNLPGDFKWDQDIIPSELELAFGRVDFADLTSVAESEMFLTERYLDRLHNYRFVEPDWFMGSNSAFFYGFNNSNDGSFRSLLPISGFDNVYQNYTGSPHPQWVQNNGPFAVYMQNKFQPSVAEWNAFGMDATIFTSDQSYWGFGDVPEGNQYSLIRSLLALNTKCLVSVWTTMAINIFHQPGVGEPLGLACKQIMDHNTVNQKLEKPVQAYDTPAFWNRTQFAFYGDPSLRLFQVYPPSEPLVSSNGQQMFLSWHPSPDNRLLGYHVYKSESEFGIFERITNEPINDTVFSDPDYLPGNWYMIRAVILQETGSGVFINPSQGVFIQGTIESLGQPGPISGNSEICASTEETYSIDAVSGADSYQWTLPQGWSGNSTTNEITTLSGTVGGHIVVAAVNQYGISQNSTIAVSVLQIPDPSGEISGPDEICTASSRIYSVAEISGAVNYTWTLPEGAAGQSSANSIEVSFGSEATSGFVSVSGQNQCGDGLSSQLYTIVHQTPPVPLVTVNESIIQSNAVEGNQWYNSLGLIEDATGQNYQVLDDDYYHTIVTLSGCSSEPSEPIYVVVTNTGFTKNISSNIIVYPNPACNFLFISSGDSKLKQRVEIVNIDGKVLIRKVLKDNSPIEISNLSTGIYTARIFSENEVIIKRFIKQ